MMAKLFKNGLMAVIILSAVCAQAVPTLNDIQTWTYNNGAQGWNGLNPFGQGPIVVDNAAGGYDGNGYLRISFPSQGFPNPGSVEVTYNTVGGQFAGDYAAMGQGIYFNFNFYASNSLPSELSLYLHGANSGVTWQYNLGVPSGYGWSAYQAALVYNSGWQRIGVPQIGDDVLFSTDLSSVDWLAVYVSRFGNTGGEVFGLDNAVFTIPEPGVMCMISAVLLSMFGVFRGHVGGLLARVRTAVRGHA